MIVSVLVQFHLVAQSIGIGTASPHSSAVLDITSTSKGLLIPRMTSAERSGIPTPASGLIIYDLNTESVWINTSGGWVNMNNSGTPGWSLAGNSGSNPGTNFIGTTDNQSLMFKVNNQPFGMLCINRSIFWGEQAGTNNTGFSNIAIGAKALYTNTNRGNLVAIGDSALYNNGLGVAQAWHATENTAIGSKALYSNTIGFRNTATGFRSLYHNTVGSSNTATGVEALGSNINGHENTATGHNSLYSNTSGHNNTANGHKAMFENTTGEHNSAFGSDALFSNTSGSFNTANGDGALAENTTGDHNAALGTTALSSNTNGSWNTANGSSALVENTTGDFNAAFGNYALGENGTGSGNTALGASSLSSNIAGSNATAIGYRAMLYSNNTSVGFINYNVAIGYEALRGGFLGNNTGNYNTTTGYTSLWSNTSGSNNTATGYRALYTNSTGNHNTSTGQQALESNTSGGSNTGCGYFAVQTNSTGNYNSGFGRGAYFTSGALDNTTCIGYNSGGQVNNSNRVEIGNTSVSWIGGQQTWSTYSDGRIKDNVVSDVPGLDFITLLRPVTYNLNIHRQNEMVYAGRKEEDEWPTKYDVEKIRTTGFIAQEVAQAAKDVGYDFSGVDIPKDPNELYSLRYADFVVPLVKAVQEQQEMIETQQAIIQAQQQLLEDIQRQLQEIQVKEN